ncbi:membrane protein [Histomonas meleagridis]|uniref:uncharacterized protein n=1 Tax=Histomonas meleagridis TaxID=135588 RepID=UPI003559D492|nr:membrane protein [Histomonas meleagridis]KAH0798661.1 membrane protein [Histomonas meleagridis]
MNTRNIVLSAICGLFFAAAWWIFIDGVSVVDVKDPDQGAGPFYLYCPGILATIGLFLMSNLPSFMFSKEDTGEETSLLQKLILVLSVACMLAGIIVAIWCYVAKKGDRDTGLKQWRGVSMIIQSIVISLVSFAWNFFYKDPNGF